MCGLEVRERFPGSGSPGALLGLLGQLGAAVAGYVPPSFRAFQQIVCIALFIPLISHRIATRRYPLTLVYGAYGGWDGVLGVLFGASVLVSRRAFCTHRRPYAFASCSTSTRAALRAGDGGLRVAAAPRR